MSRLRVVPVVEGDGEVESIRILLERIWGELLGGEYIEVLKPSLHPKGSLKKEEGFAKAVKLARLKLANPPTPSEADPAMVLVLIDADEDCAREWGPKLLSWGRKTASDLDIAYVLAVAEYETWFAASAESLGKYLDLPPDFVAPDDAEGSRQKKAWVKRHFRGRNYSPTADQPGMTRAIDLASCHRRSASFRKLCKELGRRLEQDRPGG